MLTVKEKVSLLPPSATPTVEEDDEPQPDARLQDHDESQAAFNPETGEINWDCPCLGGMAYGPCGEEFRAAFSCFVYSKEEPKGMDCIDKFKFVALSFTFFFSFFSGNHRIADLS